MIHETCHSEFANSENGKVRNTSTILAFINMWFHSFLLTEKHVNENPEEIVCNTTKSGFTEETANLPAFPLNKICRLCFFSLCMCQFSTCCGGQRSVAIGINYLCHYTDVRRAFQDLSTQKHFPSN